MKRGVVSIVAVAVFVTAAAYIFLGRGRPQFAKVAPNEKAATPSVAPPVAAPAESPSATPDLSVYRTDPRWVQWNEQAARDSKFEWKTPISFFGRIEDENGHPIAAAKVVLQWTDLSDNGSSQKTVMSDDQGLFELRDISGKRLAITQIDKEGYYAPVHGVQTSFEYAAFFEANYHQPNVNRPVVFRLRKYGERPKEMVVRQTLMSIAPDGAPHFINLQTTRKSDAAGGDISIRISRTAPSDIKRYDWSAAVEGVKGAGLIESTAEFMFEAPAEGYQMAYTYQFLQSSPDWRNSLKRSYYVAARGGALFGRIEIEFMPKYQSSAAVGVRFFVNPTGSRNLEYPPDRGATSN